MTPTRQAALRAAIDVWSVEVQGEPFEREGARRILHLADIFERWLNQPTAQRLILTPGDMRRITTRKE
jgi:hypothetical protein